MTARTKKVEIPSCLWRQDIEGNWWTDCDHGFVFTDCEGPKAHGMKFCCYCGRSIKQRSCDGD